MESRKSWPPAEISNPNHQPEKQSHNDPLDFYESDAGYNAYPADGSDGHHDDDDDDDGDDDDDDGGDDDDGSRSDGTQPIPPIYEGILNRYIAVTRDEQGSLLKRSRLSL